MRPTQLRLLLTLILSTFAPVEDTFAELPAPFGIRLGSEIQEGSMPIKTADGLDEYVVANVPSPLPELEDYSVFTKKGKTQIVKIRAYAYHGDPREFAAAQEKIYAALLKTYGKPRKETFEDGYIWKWKQGAIEIRLLSFERSRLAVLFDL